MHDTIIRYIKFCSSVLLIGATISVILYKIAASSLSFGAITLDTTDVLSIILAIFSVLLSVMFYFKSSEESGRFYENSYKFTKDVSEILGRIEAGFGERLRHLDESYSTIGKKFDSFATERGHTEEQVREEEADVKQARQERDALIEDLITKAHLSDEERRKVSEQLNQKDQELDYAKKQLFEIQSRLRQMEETARIQQEIDPLTNKALEELSIHIEKKHFLVAPYNWLVKRVLENISKLSTGTLSVLQDKGIIDETHSLTREGRSILRAWAQMRT